MQWIDVLSGEKTEEYEFPEGFACLLAEGQLVQAEWVKVTISCTEEGKLRILLELEVEPSDIQRIAAAGLWGLSPEDAGQLDPYIKIRFVLEARPELLARYGEELNKMEDKIDCLTIVQGEGQFPEFLKLGNYNLVRMEQ